MTFSIKKCIVLAVTICSLCLQPISVSAYIDYDHREYDYEYMEKYQNGKRCYQGKHYNSTEELLELEDILDSNDEFIWIGDPSLKSGLQTFKDSFEWNGYTFSHYINDDFSEKEGFKIYLCKPVWDMYIEELDIMPTASDDTQLALECTTVILDYKAAEEVDKVGTIQNDYGDFIPDEITTGYVKFTTPIATEILMEQTELNRYVLVPLEIGENLVKLRCQHFIIKEVGGISVEDEDNPYLIEFDPHDGDPPLEMHDFNLTEDFTKKEPFELNLTEFEIKHEMYLPEGDESPSEYFNRKGEEKEILIQKQEKNRKIGTLLALLCIAGVIIGAAYVIIKKKEDEEDDEDYEETDDDIE